MSIKKSDIVLILVIIIISFALFIYKNANINNGDYINIFVNNELYGTYQLSENLDIPIIINNTVTNVVTINDYHVYMKEAVCPDGLCMSQQKISKNNETICCLPNKVVICVSSDNIGDYDAITQ